MSTFAKSTFSAATYAAFRPSYPASLYNTVLAYHRGPRKLALDLGCGTGIVTRELGKHFENAIGTDPSAGMIKQASSSVPQENVTFRAGSAETGSSFLDPGSVDCVVAGQAAHWFAYSALWGEMARVVRQGGTCAFWGYKDNVFVDYPRVTEIWQRYCYDPHPDLLGSYWQQPGRSYVQDKLRVIQPPAEDWEAVERIEYEPATNGKRTGEGTLFMERRVTVGQCKQYLTTFSAYHAWQEAHPDQISRAKGGKGDISDLIFDELAKEEDYFKNEDNEVDIEWGSGLVMARRK